MGIGMRSMISMRLIFQSFFLERIDLTPYAGPSMLPPKAKPRIESSNCSRAGVKPFSQVDFVRHSSNGTEDEIKSPYILVERVNAKILFRSNLWSFPLSEQLKWRRPFPSCLVSASMYPSLHLAYRLEPSFDRDCSSRMNSENSPQKVGKIDVEIEYLVAS
ncbi:hypothetical protein H5410_050489 [Solanum commersonii]|uniref:Uncharacterized protein n=1 Tax=Solanum commersonii TaxID=4109 RepID=A0A9J5WY25_SOLCO|nr:hypothetical protein H5410_050489 [Solanum commersonii]